LKQPAANVKSSKTISTKNIINRSRLVQKIPNGYTQKKNKPVLFPGKLVNDRRDIPQLDG
jgi:hypothetical protein